MKYDEFKNNFLDMIKDPDKAVSTANEFMEQVKEVFDNQDSYIIKIKELEDKNNDLRDANIKLLMRETAPIQEQPKEKSVQEIKQEILNKIKGGN